MKDFQQRVVDEKAELDIRLSKLRDFMDGDIFKTVRIDERSRLLRQAIAMEQYQRVLDERIAAFEE